MFGIHIIWIALTLFVMVTAVAVIVGVVAYTTRSSPQGPSTVISPDGRMWWDGREWKPIPEPGPTTPQP